MRRLGRETLTLLEYRFAPGYNTRCGNYVRKDQPREIEMRTAVAQTTKETAENIRSINNRSHED